jgi:tetratricopeptide (TPR) repeat protein
MERARELLDRGEVASALEFYGKAFDPDALDEVEARSMLIDARSLLARKRVQEALEAFEDALLMGTDVQRRQALEGIADIVTIRERQKSLALTLQAELKNRFVKKTPEAAGMAAVPNEDGIVAISADALAALPEHLAKGGRFQPAPPRLKEAGLPFAPVKSMIYTDESDVRHILEIAAHLAADD